MTPVEPPAQHDAVSSRALHVVGSVGLGACLVAFACALIGTNMLAVQRFRHAAASSAELAAIQAVAAAAANQPGDSQALETAVRAYRRAVLAETRLVAPAGSPEQDVELRTADRLVAAARFRQVSELTEWIAVVARHEHHETSAIAGEMDALGRRVVWLAAFLAVAAIGSTALALWGLLGDKRRLEREVAARTKELVAADRSRRLFFAKVSHELRTPVTVMRGEAEVALAGPAQARPLRDALDQVVASAEELERRIADLLGLAQADDGQLRLAAEPFDLGAMAHRAADAVERQARAAEVVVGVRPPEPIAVIGDERWLRQAMTAALDNAIRHSPTGGRIDVAVRRDARDAVLEIADRGSGMSAVGLKHAFDAFFRDEPAGTGSGLGLALARWVVERHGGTIAARNREGGGCVIAVRLPMAA